MTNLLNTGPLEAKHGYVEITVGGMSCGGCAQTVQQALSMMDGVVLAKVSHAAGKAQINYNPDKVTVQQLQEAIQKAGYQAGEPTTRKIQIVSQNPTSGCCCSPKNT